MVSHYEYVAPIFKNERTTFERIEKFISNDYFADCNLRGRLYRFSRAVSIKHYSSEEVSTISFNDAVQFLSSKGKPLFWEYFPAASTAGNVPSAYGAKIEFTLFGETTHRFFEQ